MDAWQTIAAPDFEPEIHEVPGARYNPYKTIEKRWDSNKGWICPACNGSGMCWAGWFQCDECECIALTRTGMALVPVNDPTIAGGPSLRWNRIGED